MRGLLAATQQAWAMQRERQVRKTPRLRHALVLPPGACGGSRAGVQRAQLAPPQVTVQRAGPQRDALAAADQLLLLLLPPRPPRQRVGGLEAVRVQQHLGRHRPLAQRRPPAADAAARGH